MPRPRGKDTSGIQCVSARPSQAACVRFGTRTLIQAAARACLGSAAFSAPEADVKSTLPPNYLNIQPERREVPLIIDFASSCALKLKDLRR